MADFQSKLSELEKSQSELVTENAKLKDLCLYLNEQRMQSVPSDMVEAAISRDSGDGSSGSSQSVDKLVLAVHESDVMPSLDDAVLKPTKGTFLLHFIKVKWDMANLGDWVMEDRDNAEPKTFIGIKLLYCSSFITLINVLNQCVKVVHEDNFI